MTERSTGLPSPEQVIELLDGEFARAGYEVDHVTIDTRARPARITVVADGDIPLTWTPSPNCRVRRPRCWTAWTPARPPTSWRSPRRAWTGR